MADPKQIVQACSADIPQISAFLEKAAYIHRHLDWQPLLDWVNTPPFLLLKEQSDQLAGILAIPPDPPQVAWVHCFAASGERRLNDTWQALFSAAQPYLLRHRALPYAVGLEDWFSELLVEEGFAAHQEIVVLFWNHHLPPRVELPKNYFLRPMEQADLPAVAEVDARSFEPVWVNSFETLRLAYLQSERCSVIEAEGKIVAYEISSAGQYAAHLARLAVLPEYRQQNLGKAMAREMLAHFARHGMVQVTVNTQSDNAASLHLYQSLGFEITHETYPVLTL